MNQLTMEEYIRQYRQIRIKDCVLVHEPKHVVRAHMVQLMIFAGLTPVELLHYTEDIASNTSCPQSYYSKGQAFIL